MCLRPHAGILIQKMKKKHHIWGFHIKENEKTVFNPTTVKNRQNKTKKIPLETEELRVVSVNQEVFE